MAVQSNEGLSVIRAISERGGRSTFRIWLHDQSSGAREGILSDLKALGSVVEIIPGRLLAVDAGARNPRSGIILNHAGLETLGNFKSDTRPTDIADDHARISFLIRRSFAE
jgi:hypothetical protein